MYYRMPPSKTGWPSLNAVIFPPVIRLFLDDPKTVTTPEIIDHFHELILEDGRISDKSIAEQLGISRERVGSTIPENLYMRKLSAKLVPKCLNAYEKCQRCQLYEKLSEFFRLGAIEMSADESSYKWTVVCEEESSLMKPVMFNPTFVW